MSSTFPRFSAFPPEIRFLIWEQALHDEVESRYVLVHRRSLKVVPHKISTRSAIKEVTREARSCALQFYDIRLDVWTFVPSMDYDHEAQLFLNDTQLVSGYLPAGMDPMDVWRGLHGEMRRHMLGAAFWFGRFRLIMPESVKHDLNTSPQHTAHSQRVGSVFISSKYDKFTLSSSVYGGGPYRRLRHVDLCELSFMRPHETRVFGNESDYDSHYDARHITAKMPAKVLERIRCVVDAREVKSSVAYQHDCQNAKSDDRRWRLGTFKGADQLYTVALDRIPSDGLRFTFNQALVKWKRTVPGTLPPNYTQQPFVCECSEEDEDDIETGSATSVETPES